MSSTFRHFILKSLEEKDHFVLFIMAYSALAQGLTWCMLDYFYNIV